MTRPYPTNPQPPRGGEAGSELAGRLQELALDRTSPARALARELASELHAWILPRSGSWSAEQASGDLEAGWRAWAEAHAWRGVCARLLHDLRSAVTPGENPREALLPLLRGWLAEEDGSAPGHASRVGALATHATVGLSREDEVLVHGYSELCVRALVAAQRAGLAPHVLLSECAPDQGGKRAARELLAHGLRVQLVWDLAAVTTVERVDHVWVGPEAVGAGAFIAPVGTGLLLERARECEVPSRALAAAGDLLPGGELELPAWGAGWGTALWPSAPEGVELESEPYELVDADRVDGWITDAGVEHFANFCLRALPSEAAAPLTTP